MKVLIVKLLILINATFQYGKMTRRGKINLLTKFKNYIGDLIPKEEKLKEGEVCSISDECDLGLFCMPRAWVFKDEDIVKVGDQIKKECIRMNLNPKIGERCLQLYHNYAIKFGEEPGHCSEGECKQNHKRELICQIDTRIRSANVPGHYRNHDFLPSYK